MFTGKLHSARPTPEEEDVGMRCISPGVPITIVSCRSIIHIYPDMFLLGRPIISTHAVRSMFVKGSERNEDMSQRVIP